jgi:hypothetical protein
MMVDGGDGSAIGVVALHRDSGKGAWLTICQEGDLP